MFKSIKTITLFMAMILIAFVNMSCYKGKDLPNSSGKITNTKSMSAPDSISASNGVYKDKIAVSWAKVEGAEKYYLYRCAAPIDGNCESNALAFIKVKEFNASQTYYEDKDAAVTVDKIYCYKVSVWASGFAESVKSKSAKGKKVSAFGLAVPPAWTQEDSGAVTASKGTYKDKIHLEWMSVANADGYEIYRCEAVNNKCDDPASFYSIIADVDKNSPNKFTKEGQTFYFFDDTNVQAGKIYCYFIKPYQISGDPNSPKIYGDGSFPVKGAIADTFTQAKPDQGSITSNDSSNPNFPVRSDAIRISWSKVNGAEKYYIYRAVGDAASYYFEIKVVENLAVVPTVYDAAGDIFFDSVNNKYVYYDKNVQRGVTYWYKIKAWSLINGFSDETDPISGKLPEGIHLDPGVFPAPTGINAAKGASLSKVSITWNNVAGAVSYLIQKGEAVSGVCGSTYTDLSGTSVNSYEDSSVEEGKLYCYRVKAYDNSNNYSDFSSTDTGYRKLSAPQTIAASKGTSEPDITINGYSHAKASSYKLYKANYNGTCGAFTELAAIAGTSYLDTAATVGNRYCYKVQALSQYTGYSDLSDAYDIGFKKLSAPVSVLASDDMASVTITWSNTTGATRYDVFRSDDSYTAVKCSSTDGVLGCADLTVVAGTLYTYKVKAYTSNYDSNQYSDFSAVYDTGYKKLSSPSLLPIQEVGKTLKISWTAVAGENITGYEILRAPESASGDEGDYVVLTTITDKNITSYDDGTVPWDEYFFYKIRSINSESGAKSPESTYKKEKRQSPSEGAYQTLGTAGFSSAAGKYTSIQFFEGIAYVAYNQPSDDKIYVKKYNGSNWEDLGIAGTGANDYAMTKIIVKSSTEIYVAYAKSDDNIAVKKGTFSSNTWTWTDLSFTGKGYSYFGVHYSFLTMAISASGNIFVTYKDTSQKIIVKQYNGSWSNVGTNGEAGTGLNQLGGSYLAIYVKGETPYVAYIETSTHYLICKKYSSSWVQVGGTIDANPDYQDSSYGAYYGSYTNLIVAGDSEIYVSYKQKTDTFIHVKKYDGSSWADLGASAATTEKATRNSMKLIKDVIYLGYQAPSDGNKAKIIKYKSGAWVKVGGANKDGVVGTLPSETDSYVSIDFYNGSIYAAYTDASASGKVTVKY